MDPKGVDAWWLVSDAIHFRCGIDRLLVQVREVLGRDPLNGSAYVFRNRNTTPKCWWWMLGGVWLSARRLHHGRFIWASGERLWSLSRAPLRWLCVAWTGIG